MVIFRNCAAAIAVLTITTFFASLADAVEMEADWLDDLMMQLAVEEACDVMEIISSEEGLLGSKVFIDARVQCEDGRQFDASRIEPDITFTIRICEVVDVVC